MINVSAFTNEAILERAKSLSITPSTPIYESFFSILGMPPPPPVIPTVPCYIFSFIASIPIKSLGLGEGTTFLYPLPESSTIVEFGLFFSASSFEE